MMPPKMPPAPTPIEPDKTWKHYSLYRHVCEAISTLPLYFKTETIIGGIMATDLFTLAAALGATIEDQVVSALNGMREIWDPDGQYGLFSFVRQPQTFPDVLLRSAANPEEVVMGLELKGWYLLAKEEEPSFRYQVTPSACNPQDLIVVVPWALTNIVSGTPRVFSPYVVSARYAALYRNYHWQSLRAAKSGTEIKSPRAVSPYPKKSDEISDKPISDSGGNFGRFARTGLMDDYLHRISQEPLCGIPARYWRSFFKVFQEQRTAKALEAEVDRLVESLSKESGPIDAEAIQRVRVILSEIQSIILRR